MQSLFNYTTEILVTVALNSQFADIPASGLSTVRDDERMEESKLLERSAAGTITIHAYRCESQP